MSAVKPNVYRDVLSTSSMPIGQSKVIPTRGGANIQMFHNPAAMRLNFELRATMTEMPEDKFEEPIGIGFGSEERVVLNALQDLIKLHQLNDSVKVYIHGPWLYKNLVRESVKKIVKPSAATTTREIDIFFKVDEKCHEDVLRMLSIELIDLHKKKQLEVFFEGEKLKGVRLNIGEC